MKAFDILLNKKFSRRQFLMAGAVGGTAGCAGWTDLFPGRVLRKLIAEASRDIRSPAFIPQPTQWSDNAVTAAWLGHSTVLINFYGLTILTDPALFERIGINCRFGTLGPKRLVAPALGLHELPPIDLLLLSHAHMDHFDLPTLRRISPETRVVAARATADLLRHTRLRHAVELGWGERQILRTRHGELALEACEVRHWGARWKHDVHRGYNGYLLEREGRKILFGGDTAMSPAFRSLRSKGPFDLAIMPIGAYQPWTCSHCTPEEAARMALEAGAQRVLPIHHKTFSLGQEHSDEPMERLQGCLDPEQIALSEIGQTFSLA